MHGGEWAAEVIKWLINGQTWIPNCEERKLNSRSWKWKTCEGKWDAVTQDYANEVYWL